MVFLSFHLIYSIFIEYRTVFAFVLLPCLPGREAAAISTQPTVRVWLDKITRMGDPGLAMMMMDLGRPRSDPLFLDLTSEGGAIFCTLSLPSFTLVRMSEYGFDKRRNSLILHAWSKFFTEVDFCVKLVRNGLWIWRNKKSCRNPGPAIVRWSF